MSMREIVPAWSSMRLSAPSLMRSIAYLAMFAPEAIDSTQPETPQPHG